MSMLKNKKKEKGDNMQTGTLAICDLDEEYASHLMEYISSKPGMPFRTIAFTEKEALSEYLKEEHADILLISASVMDESIRLENVRKVILLSAGNVLSEHIKYSSILKYQSGENIIRELLDYYVDVCQDLGVISVSKGNTRIIGVYSPVGRVGKTTFALTMGQILAEKQSVLYISLEEFSVLGRLLEQSYPGDLSDLMYFFKQNPESIAIKLQAVVSSLNGMDYIPPLVFSEDLRNIDTDEWIGLVQKIAATDIYENIILDLSSMVKDVFKIQDICSIIYMPIGDDIISKMKLNAYEEYLLKSEKEDIINRTEKIKLPKPDVKSSEDNYMEIQLWGALGDFVRDMLSEVA